MKNYRIMLIAIIGASLITGTAFGFWGGQTYVRDRFHKNCSNGKYFKAKSLGRLDDMLQLTDEQQTSIEAILENTAGDHKKILQDFRDKMKSVRDKRSEEIRMLLTEEQREKFDTLKEKRQDRPLNRMHRRGMHMRGGDSDEKCL